MSTYFLDKIYILFINGRNNMDSNVWQYSAPELNISKSKKFNSLAKAIEEVIFLLLKNNKFDVQLTRFQLDKYIIFYYNDTKTGNLAATSRICV